MNLNDIYRELWREAMIYQLKQIAFATAPTLESGYQRIQEIENMKNVFKLLEHAQEQRQRRISDNYWRYYNY